MRRREFIAGTATTAALSFAWPACAQTNTRSPGVKRLAMFHPTRPPEEQTPNRWPVYKAYFDELNRLGYVEGQNLIVERYSAFGQPSRIADAAREIVASRPDVVWPSSGQFIKEIMALTTSIPMVGTTGDPVAFGFSSSLARPDKNFTGVVLDAGLEVWAKRVQLLLEVARKVTKVGYLDANPTSFTPGPTGANIREAAQRAGVAAAFVLVAGKIDRAAYERVWSTLIVGGEKVDRTTFEETFDAINKEGVDGLIVGETAELAAYRQLIADLAARFRIPVIYTYREYVEVGGLMAYAVNTVDMMRRVANMTSQVLGGAKVSDLPFYRQTKYELVLNQKAATSLGLEFPASLLTTADAVVD
jgi:putative tryptophan/tyrosine transport system substrate-binding protein